MTLWVLLYHVSHIVRFLCLLKWDIFIEYLERKECRKKGRTYWTILYNDLLTRWVLLSTRRNKNIPFLSYVEFFLMHYILSFSKVVIYISNWNTILRWLAVISWEFNVLTHFTFINSWQFKPTCATVEDSFLSYLLISLCNINSISRLN